MKGKSQIKREKIHKRRKNQESEGQSKKERGKKKAQTFFHLKRTRRMRE